MYINQDPAAYPCLFQLSVHLFYTESVRSLENHLHYLLLPSASKKKKQQDPASLNLLLSSIFSFFLPYLQVARGATRGCAQFSGMLSGTAKLKPFRVFFVIAIMCQGISSGRN